MPFPACWMKVFFCLDVIYAFGISGFASTFGSCILPALKGYPDGSSSRLLLLWVFGVPRSLVGSLFPVLGGCLYEYVEPLLLSESLPGFSG